MQRVAITPRVMWRTKVERLGFNFHTIEGKPYWTENAAYAFTGPEIDVLEQATADLHAMSMEVVGQVVQSGDYHRLGLNEYAASLIEAGWRASKESLYGRMDFCYDGIHPPKFLEYNADTPTALFEASVVQWFWLQDVFPQADQFNSIHEKLLEAWKSFQQKHGVQKIHFCSVTEAPEDLATAEYLRDTCIQANLVTDHLDISDIGWKGGRFIDLQDRPIDVLFKLYPWEWLLEEPFGKHVAAAKTTWIEPVWKLVLSNKSILALLWEKFPKHPNLLPAHHVRDQVPGPCVRKPRFGREGDDIVILDASASDQPHEGVVYQRFQPLPKFDNVYPVVGSWVIDGRPAGIGIREDAGLITRNSSCFVPHYFQ